LFLPKIDYENVKFQTPAGIDAHGYLHVLKFGYLFSQKYSHGLRLNHKLWNDIILRKICQQWRNWRGGQGGAPPPWQAKCKNWAAFVDILTFSIPWFVVLRF